MEIALLNTLAPTQGWGWSGLHDMGESLFNVIIVRPLARLYLDGPTKVGFWGGARPEDICAQLSNIKGSFWASSDETQAECIDLIERHFSSWLVLGRTLGYYCVISMALYFCWRRCCLGHRPQQHIVIYQQPTKNQLSSL